MRRTARVLSATALASAALGASAAAAFADPAAEVSPRTVAPGGTVTVSVSCEGAGADAPEYIDAASEGFEDGKVRLHRVAGSEQGAEGAAYSGTARIPSGGTAPGDGGGDPATPDDGVPGDLAERGPDDLGPDAAEPADGGADRAGPADTGSAEVGPDAVEPDPLGSGDAGSGIVEPGDVGPDASDEVGPDSVPEGVPPDALGAGTDWGVDGKCPEAPGGKEKDWSASYRVERDGAARDGTEAPRPPDEHPADGTVHGVRAGSGGAFTDSVPALVTGGLLIAGAVGAAVYRLRRGGSAADRHR